MRSRVVKFEATQDAPEQPKAAVSALAGAFPLMRALLSDLASLPAQTVLLPLASVESFYLVQVRPGDAVRRRTKLIVAQAARAPSAFDAVDVPPLLVLNQLLTMMGACGDA